MTLNLKATLLSTAFKKSFLLCALHRRSKCILFFFYFIFSRFYIKPFVVTPVHKYFGSIYCVFFFFLNQIFSLFLKEKIAARYAEIVRVAKLEAGFQQVPLVQVF